MIQPQEVTKGRVDRFLQNVFNTNNFSTTKVKHIFRTPSCSPRREASKHMDDSLERLGQHLTSGQGYVKTEVDHVAYQAMFRDETNTARPHPRL